MLFHNHRVAGTSDSKLQLATSYSSVQNEVQMKVHGLWFLQFHSQVYNIQFLKMAATVGASDPSSGPDSSPESPYSSPDSSPTIRRPFTTVGWEHPYTSVSPRTRPSTTIGWESRVLEKATLERGGRRCSLGHGAGRRHSTGTRRALETSPDWCPMEVEAGGSGEDSEETDWGVSEQIGCTEEGRRGGMSSALDCSEQ